MLPTTRAIRAVYIRSSLAALTALLVPAVAQGQIFTPPTNPFASLFRLSSPDRLQVAVYLARWDFAPFDAPNVQSESLDADVSPLLTMEYVLNKHFSIGGWWNPFGGEVDAKESATDPAVKAANVDADFWDVHATYYVPERWGKGWSVQAGFSRLHYDVKLIPALKAVGAEDFDLGFNSLSFWVNKRQQVGRRKIQGSPSPIHVFVSAGYYTSSQFDRAWNVLIGGSMPLSQRLSVSSSVWINNLSHTNTRLTLGLSGTF